MASDFTILVVAGEASGDRHAAGLVGRLTESCPQRSLSWFGSGGSRMAREGVELLMDVSELAAIGPKAALANLGNYWTLYRSLLREARQRKPALAILVDFPEFNLLLARRLKALGIPVCYFISPQIWAWRTSRVRKVKRYVDLMLVILPFEEEFYQRHGVPSHYVGNPVCQWAAQGIPAPEALAPGGPPSVALLPGSRRKEVEIIFPIQLATASYMSRRRKVRFQVVTAPNLPADLLGEIYRGWVEEGNPPLDIEFCGDGTRSVLGLADCAVVKSGTSTLEAMVLGVPFAMVYRMSLLSWIFARLLVDVDTYCLANIVAGKRIVREFVQGGAQADEIGAHMLELLDDDQARRRLGLQLKEAARKLGQSDAYGEAAKQVARFAFPREEAA